jgi:hypothetical protein
VSVNQNKIPNCLTIPSPPRAEHKAEKCDKNSEIEKIKRQIYNVLDKLESLKDK